MTESEAIKALEQGDKNSYEAEVSYEEYLEAIEMGRKALEEIQAYRAIGTIERFRELTEKAEPKKPINIRPNDTLSAIFDCPSCGRTQKIQYQGFHCKECGQNLDWE